MLRPLTNSDPALLGGAMSSIISPDDLSDLHFWFRADLDVTLSGSPATDGGNLDTWGNQVASVTDFTQATGGNQPTWIDNQINGHPCVRFNGSNQWLEAPDGADTNITGVATIFAVAKVDTLVNWGMILNKTPNGLSAYYEVRVEATAGHIQNSHSGSVVTSTAAISAGSWFHTGLRRRLSGGGFPNLNDFYINGSYDSTPVGSNSSGTNSTAANIGRRPDGLYMDGDIAEIIFYTRDLSDTEVAQIHDYLTNRYGI